jgi:hypothetical protein
VSMLASSLMTSKNVSRWLHEAVDKLQVPFGVAHPDREPVR